MSEKGFKDGLVSRVKNSHTGKKYTISTAQELGKDYWTSNIFPNVFFGLFPNFTSPVITIVRNNKESAYQAHSQLKTLVTDFPENEWIEISPAPLPNEGLTEGAEAILARKK